MTASIPPGRSRGTFVGEVLANERICDEHYRLILDLETFPPTQAGQFAQLLCRPPREPEKPRVVEWAEGDWPTLTQPELAGRETMLRRPLSLAGRRDHAGGRVELDFIYRIVGVGTRWLAGVVPGDPLSILGPLGNAFSVFHDRPAAALIGGGVGIPPMLYLAETLTRAGKDVVAFVGARNAGLLPLRLLPNATIDPAGLPSRCVAELAACDVQAGIATDDGSLGRRGFVPDAFAAWLEESDLSPEQLAVYSCGPEPMMRGVGELCNDRGIACELSLERTMACGMGTCQSCVCKTRASNDRGWAFKLCCTDGPVFSSREIVWD